MGEQASQHSIELLRQIFPQMEAQCPGISFDLAVELVRDSPSTEGDKSSLYMDLSKVASDREDFFRANQALIAARDVTQKNWQKCKTLPSAQAALQRLHDFHTAYIDLHRKHTGMAFWESAGVVEYLRTLLEHYRDHNKMLQVFNEFQGNYVDFGIPTQQERLLGLAATAAWKLGSKEQSQQYTKQHFKWLKQCPFSDQFGILTESAVSDPGKYLRQIFGGAADSIEWGSKALQLIIAWAKIEVEKGLMTAREMRELFSFVRKDEQVDNPDFFLQFMKDLDFEEVAKCFYGPPDEMTPSATFLQNMQSLIDWLNLPNRPPSQAARIATAKIIMMSRLHRKILYLRGKGVLDPTIASEYSKEQMLLNAIEKLEDGFRGPFGDQADRETARRIQTALTKCFASDAEEERLISDDELQSRISDCRNLVEKFSNGGHWFLEYHTLLSQSRLQWYRYLYYRSESPDSSLEVLERAERLFNEARKRTLTPDPADSISGTINLTEEFLSQAHCKMGIMTSFVSFLEEKAASQRVRAQDASVIKSDGLAFDTYERFLKWTHRSKGRGLIELLYFDVAVVQDVAETLRKDQNTSNTSRVQSNLPSPVENLHTVENITTQDSGQVKPTAKRDTPTRLLQDAIDDKIVSKSMINEMLSKVGDDVVIVDIINIAYLGEGGFQAILYRKDTTELPIALPDLTLLAVERWVEMNLGTQENSIKKPLLKEGYASALDELTPFLMPLFNQTVPQSIKAGEVIVFCLTGVLHRIPIHALPIDGVPLIESHPVAYCQSMTTLYRGYEAVCKIQRSTSGADSLAIIPSYKEPWMKEAKAEETLLQQIKGVSKDLIAKACSGFDLTKETVQTALSDRGHLFYFGHVRYNSKSPILSALLLDEAAHKDASLEKKGNEILTVRDLFKIRLQQPALATIIGCGSGQALVSKSDDVLGLPSALLFAGASSTVSTLWPIDPDDGANFAAEFYHSFHRQQVSWKTNEKSAAQESGLKSCVNLARAMHEAVKTLRQRGEQKDAAYHWAAFYLTGFWRFPFLATK